MGRVAAALKMKALTVRLAMQHVVSLLSLRIGSSVCVSVCLCNDVYLQNYKVHRIYAHAVTYEMLCSHAADLYFRL